MINKINDPFGVRGIITLPATLATCAEIGLTLHNLGFIGTYLMLVRLLGPSVSRLDKIRSKT